MKVLKLDLLQNSHAFLREAAANVLEAQVDTAKWQFAILHVCQSVELTVKAILHKTHPVFVFEDIDKRKHTVSLTTALARLQAPEICGFTLSQKDASKVRVVSDLRNEITHSAFDLNSVSAEAQFFGVFAFVAYLQSRFLKTEIESVLPGEAWKQIGNLRSALKELAEKARMRIADEKRGSEWVWACPCCGEDTFVIEDAVDTCYTCRHQEPTAECPNCGEVHFVSEMVHVADEFDYSEDECGVSRLVDAYGYEDIQDACPECAAKIADEIEQMRQDRFYEDFQPGR